MNKNIIIIACVLLSLGRVAAQDAGDANKTIASPITKQYLPKKGDLAIGIDAIPMLEFLGNSLNGYGTNGSRNTIGAVGGSVINLDFAPKPDVSIMGKYFFKDNMAFRVNLGLLSNNSFQRAYVASDVLTVTDPLSSQNVIDCVNNQNSGGSLAVGLERRVGKSRIQGVFSADLLLAYQTSKIDYNYGNKLTTLNTKPSASTILPALDASGYRTIEKYNGNNYYTGGMLNVGVEYFICPKLAIGSEVNLMVYYKFGSSTYEEREGLNLYTNELETRSVLTSPGNNKLAFGTGNFASKLYLIFYF